MLNTEFQREIGGLIELPSKFHGLLERQLRNDHLGGKLELLVGNGDYTRFREPVCRRN